MNNLIDDPISVSITHITKDKFGNPILSIPIPDTKFLIGQLVQADIYEDYIIIAPVPPKSAN